MLWPKHINSVICGDAIEVMGQIPDGVIQCCVCSPPYWGLRDYGLEPTVWGGDNGCRHEWQTEKGFTNSTKGNDGSTTMSDPGHSTASRFDSQHSFCSLCSAWRGNLGLEPTPELYIQHLVQIFREVRRVLRDNGTLWLNIGDSYVSARGRWSSVQQTISGHSRNEPVDGNRPDQTGHPYLKDKDVCGIPWSLAFALRDDGWWFRQDIIWAKGCSGEYKGGSVMPESVEDRCTKSHEYLFLLSKSANYYYDHEAIKEDSIDPESISGRRPRNPRQADQTGDKLLVQNIYKIKDPIPKRNRRSVWVINPEPTPYAHFATFPQKLVEPPIIAGSKAGDIVLDPFSGSGTVGVVAKRLRRKYVLIDLSAEYNKIAEDRLRQCEMELT